MADFKRFTGFIAPDGTTHETLAKVKQHVLKLKVTEAADKFAQAAFDENFGITTPGQLREFLLTHQDAIKAIFAQSVRERAASKKKAVVTA